MESERPNDTADHAAHADQLAELRRAELLMHTRYPRLGHWYPPLTGLVAAVYVAGFALPSGAGAVLWTLIVLGVVMAMRRYQRLRGAEPDPRRSPALIRREIILFVVAYIAIIAALVALAQIAYWWMVALAAFVLFTAGTAVYGARYARATRRAEAEAGLGDAPQTR